MRGDAGLEQGALPSSSNNFQARYAIRHPWTGPIACANPQRGVWGGPPPKETRTSQTLAATGLAFAPRTGLALAAVVKRDVPEIAVKADANAQPVTPSGSAAPPAPTDVPAHETTKSGGGGCATSSGANGVLALAFSVLFITRRRRQ